MLGWRAENTSTTLQSLKIAGLVRSERRGKEMWHSLSDPEGVSALLEALHDLAHPAADPVPNLN